MSATLIRHRDTLTAKNSKTGKAEAIVQHDLAFVAWGLQFFVDCELDAFKAAYEYRNSLHGYKVDYAAGRRQWMVTVFNEDAKIAGIEGAK